MTQAYQSAHNFKNCHPQSYNVGDFIWLDKRYFTDAVYKVQTPRKLSAKRIGSFEVMYLIRKDAIRIELPDSICAYDVVHIEHTKRHYIQPPDIVQDRAPPAELNTDHSGDQVIKISSIVLHRRCGRGYQLLAVRENSPVHEAQWPPLMNFINPDGTITAAMHLYLEEDSILHHLP